MLEKSYMLFSDKELRPLGAYSVPQTPSCVVIPPQQTCPLELRILTLNTISWNNTYWLC